jgi:MFS family permease
VAAVTRALEPHLALLRRRGGFRLLFLAAFASGIGTLMAVVALTVDVYERTDSGRWVGALLVADFLPTIVIGLLLGPLVDRFSRRRLLIASDLVRLAAFAALPFAPNPEAIVGLALVVGFANGFFVPAAYASLPNLVDGDELPRANSLLQASSNLTWMLGPLIGGALLALSGPDLPYALNAATFALSALLLLRIPGASFQTDEPLARGHWRDLAEGFAAVRRSRAVLTVAVAWTIAMLGIAGVNVAEVFLVRDVLDAGNVALGVVLASSGLGLVVGSLIAAPLLERMPLPAIYGGSLALMAAGALASALAPSVPVLVATVVLLGIGNGAATVCNPLLVQRGVPDRVRGRAFTTVMSLNFAALGLAMAAAGPLTDAVGARWTFVAAAISHAVASVIGLAMLRGVRADAPSAPPEADVEALPPAPASVPHVVPSAEVAEGAPAGP